MVRTLKWLAPVVALGLMVGLSNSTRAEEAKSTGTVAGKVVNAEGKGVAGARVRLVAAAPAGATGEEHGKKHLQAEGEKPKKGEKGEKMKAVAEGTTNEDGTFSLADVPAGDYTLMANAKGQGQGREKVSVKAGEKAEVTLTLKAGKKAAKPTE